MEYIFGICDDCQAQVDLLAGYIGSFSNIEKFIVIQSTDPADFLAQLKTTPPQVVFLDVDMPGMNGIKLGEEIKALYSNAVIVYVTAHEEYAYQAFQVRAFHYLLKPVTRDKFCRVLRDIFDEIRTGETAAQEKMFSVQIRGEMIRLRYADIVCFEKVGHKIEIHSSDRNILYYAQMYELLSTLDPSVFARCHQGYIVNLCKIRSYKDNTLYLENGARLPVGKTYAEDIRARLAKYLFGGKETV